MPKIPVLNIHSVQPNSFDGNELNLNTILKHWGREQAQNPDVSSGSLFDVEEYRHQQKQRSNSLTLMKIEKSLTEVKDQVLETMASLKGEKSFGYTNSLVKFAQSWAQPVEPFDGAEGGGAAHSELMEKYGFDVSTEPVQSLQQMLRSLPTDLREQYNPILKQRMTRLFRRTGAHEETQKKRALLQSYQETIQSSLEAISKNPNDPTLRNNELDSISHSISLMGATLGWNEERIDAEVNQRVEAVHLSVINALIANHQADTAQEYFAKHQEEIVFADKPQLQDRIDRQFVLQEGEKLAVQIELLPKQEQPQAMAAIKDAEIRVATDRARTHHRLLTHIADSKANYANVVFIREFIELGQTPPPMSEIMKQPQWQNLSLKNKETLQAMWEERAGIREQEIFATEELELFRAVPAVNTQEGFRATQVGHPHISSGPKWKVAQDQGLVDPEEAEFFSQSLQRFESGSLRDQTDFVNTDYKTEGHAVLSPATIEILEHLRQTATDTLRPDEAIQANRASSPEELKALFTEEKDRLSIIDGGLRESGIDPQLYKVALLDLAKQVHRKEKQLGHKLKLSQIVELVDENLKSDRKTVWKESVDAGALEASSPVERTPELRREESLLSQAENIVVGGTKDAAINLLTLVTELGQGVRDMKIGNTTVQEWLDDWGIGGRMPIEIERMETSNNPGVQMARGLFSFALGFLVSRRIFAKGNAVLSKEIFSSGNVTAGIAADLLTVDRDQNISNLFNEMAPELRNPLTDFLASKIDDSELEKALKNVIEGGAMGEAFELTGKGVKHLVEFAKEVKRSGFVEAVPEWLRSERGSIRMGPNAFVNSPKGGIDFGEIPEMVADGGIEIPRFKIRLQVGTNDWGLSHLENNLRRMRGILNLPDGFENARDFIHHVTSDFDEAFFELDPYGRVLLVKGGVKERIVVVELKHEEGGFYSVTTAYPAEPRYLEDGIENQRFIQLRPKNNSSNSEFGMIAIPGMTGTNSESSDQNLNKSLDGVKSKFKKKLSESGKK